MRLMITAAIVAASASAASASFAFKDFYVSIDGRPDNTGIYSALPSPNLNRLTVTWAHAFPTGYSNLTASSNHYHRIGAYSLTGPASAPTEFFFNRHIPEWNGTSPAQQNRFLRVGPGTGPYAGRAVVVDHPNASVADHSYYDNLTFASVHQQEAAALSDPLVAGVNRLADGTFTWTGQSLPASARASTDVGWMYTSSAYSTTPAVPNSPSTVWHSRYTKFFDDAQVALRLVSKDAGFGIGDLAGNAILNNPGDTQLLGTGRTWEFTPVFNFDPATTFNGQVLTATFKLVDLNPVNPLLESGEFTFWVQVPEPATLSVLAGVGLLALRRSRRA